MRTLASAIRWFGYIAGSLIVLWGLLTFSWHWEVLLFVSLPVSLVVGFTYVLAWLIEGLAKPKT